MKERTPLDLLQKWLVSQYWIRHQPPLTRSGLVVFMRLLDRQNSKTGRCDPSAIGLLEETGLSERSVRGAFKELEDRGALKRHRAARRARNQFLIFSVEELGENRSFAELKMRSGARTGLQAAAAPAARHCRQGLQRVAPEPIKETKKKLGSAEKAQAMATASTGQYATRPAADIDLGEFERRVVKVFEREGHGYVGLLTLPEGQVEQAFKSFRDEARSFAQSVGDLLMAYRSGQD